MSAEHFEDGDVAARFWTKWLLIGVVAFSGAAFTILLITGN